MPRFFFDVFDENGWHRDRNGVELESFEEATEQAISLLPDIARAELPDSDRHVVRCEIRNAESVVIHRGELVFRGERIGGQDSQ